MEGVPQIPAEPRRRQTPAQKKLPNPPDVIDGPVLDEMGEPISIDGKYHRNSDRKINLLNRLKMKLTPKERELTLQKLAELEDK